MGWFPVGPAFVFAPRDANYRRLSRRNEKGRQTIVTDLAVDPTFDPSVPGAKATIYIAEGAGLGGAWRSNDDGATWTPIVDALRQQFQNPYIALSCIAVNPSHPEIIYVGTAGGAGWPGPYGTFVSTDHGNPGSWSATTSIPPNVNFRKIVVDARTAANPATTVLYAATDGGVLRSADGGQTWVATPVVAGDAHGLAAYFDPITGTAQVYAAVWGPAGSPNLGLYYATDPSAPANWSNLNNLGIGLPARTSGSFDTVLVDLCVQNPLRAYVWFLLGGTTVGLYTTVAPPTSWTQVPGAAPPGWIRQDTLAFAVAPNSPGDGASDILVLGSVTIQRSTDAGMTWKEDAAWLHVDHRVIAFAPTRPALGTVPVPVTYVGCDGGVGKSTRFADPAVAIDVLPADYNETALPPRDSHLWQNCNRGRQSIDLEGYASPNGYPALSYVASWDSGIKGGDGATWRGLWDGDSYPVAAAPGPGGVVLWSALYLSARFSRWVDVGDFSPAMDQPTLNGVRLELYSPPVVDINGACLAGVLAQNLIIVARVPQQGNAIQISQDFTGVGWVRAVAVDPSNRDVLYCLTTNYTAPERLWTTTSASTASASTVWTEIAAGKPIGQDPSSLAVSQGGILYVGMNFSSGQAPLYAIASGAWVAQTSTGAPSYGYISRLVADPLQTNVLYAIFAYNTVYRLTLSGGTWTWSQFVSDGLPGQVLVDLDAALVTGGAGSQKVVLRAATPTRGVFETDADPTAIDPPVSLYVRRHFLDTGWLNAAPDFVPSPYNPNEIVAHYQCADLKIDPPQPDWFPWPWFCRIFPWICRPWPWSSAFYQTDPEWNQTLPLDPVLFDELREGQTALWPLRDAWVHVQVHNRSRTPTAVNVWTLYTNAAAGLPPLNATWSGGSFNFWSQFTPSGMIVPALPPDSLWKEVGPPRPVSGVDATHPQVASWTWRPFPPLPPWPFPPNTPSCYCFVTFLHSAASPVGETTRVDVDQITATNRQVGLKNVSVCLPLGPYPWWWWLDPWWWWYQWAWGFRANQTNAYLEFHNAGAEPREVDLLLDLRGLPPELAFSFRLTSHEMDRPPAQSIVGAGEVGREKISILEKLSRLLRTVAGILRSPREKRAPELLPLSAFAPAIYEAERGGLVEVRGVRLRPSSRGALLLSLRNTGRLEPGATYHFDVLQRRRGKDAEPKLVGGARYVVRIAGERGRVIEPDRPLEDEGPIRRRVSPATRMSRSPYRV